MTAANEIIRAYEEAANAHELAIDSAHSLMCEAVRWLAGAVGGRARAGDLLLLTLANGEGFLDNAPEKLRKAILKYA